MSLLLTLLAQTSISLALLGAYLCCQVVKNLPAKQESWVPSLGREDPLEGEIATHSSTLAWRIPWMEEPGGLQSMGSQRVRYDWGTDTPPCKLSRIKIPNKKHSTSSDSDPSFLYLFCSIILSTWNLYFVYFILYFSTEDVSFLRPNTLEFCSWLYLCSTLCDPMESSPPGSSVHGIL